MKEKKNYKKSIPVEKYEPEQDNIITKAQEIIDKKGKIILVVSVLVIIVTAVLFYYRSVSKEADAENREKASTALSRVMPLLHQEQYQRALEGDPNLRIRGQEIIGLIDIIKRYEGTDQALLAAFYAGKAYMDLNDNESAEKYFKMALDSESEVVKEGAYSGLGKMHELKGEYDLAAELYEKAAEIAESEIAKEKFYFYSANCYEKAGNKEKAGQLYKQILSIEKPQFEGMAKSALLRLGMKID